MAGDWIKMRVDLSDDPAVIALACDLGVDEYSIVGRLHKLWSWADKHCHIGHAKSVTFVWINRYVGLDLFAEAMERAGWLASNADGIEFPKFDRHNGKSAKTRAEATERKRKEREEAERLELARQMSQQKCDESETREEKRREENIKTNTPLPPEGGRRPARQTTTLKTFIDECRTKNERPLRDYKPLWDYASGVGLDTDYVALAWAEFCRRCMPGGVEETKKQKDWRKAFRNYIEKNYLKLWAIDQDGKYFLTTLGKQAQQYQETKEAA